jgi:hypothetical protein
MSWHFSRALEADYLRARSWAGKQSAQSRSTNTAVAYSEPVKETGYFQLSRFGTMLEPSTVQFGEDVLTWYLAASPVKPTVRRLEAALRRTTYGRKCGESWQRQLPGTYLPRTLQKRPLTARQTILKRWVTRPIALCSARTTWERRMREIGSGYVHTPTTKANYAAPSMQKWPACREFVRRFGKPHPMDHEYLMGWPIGWSGLKRLEMGKFQSWQLLHGDL